MIRCANQKHINPSQNQDKNYKNLFLPSTVNLHRDNEMNFRRAENSRFDYNKLITLSLDQIHFYMMDIKSCIWVAKELEVNIEVCNWNFTLLKRCPKIWKNIIFAAHFKKTVISNTIVLFENYYPTKSGTFCEN